MRLRGLPVFWHTLLLLLASLIASQMVSIAMLLSLPAPRPDFNRLSDIADTLAGQTGDPRHDSRERALLVRWSPTPPVPGDQMTSEPRFAARLAQRIGVSPTRVLLFYEPDQRASFPFRDSRRPERMVPMRRGEPLFFNTVIAALHVDGGWRVVQTPPRPIVSTWQKRLILWFGVSALVLLPFAWIFARALTRPIRSFAEAADRMGGDPLAPRIPEQGPAELRTAAHALNRMQQRLADYVAERTAMIGAIAHDLRTPLTRIAFRIEAAPEAVRDKVQNDVEQMRAMIAATIGFVRGSVTHGDEVGDVHLDRLLRRLVAEEHDMGRRVTAGPMAQIVIRGDPVSLARLFQNLIDNGIAYGSEVVVSLAREGHEAVARVCDRGPGLPEEKIEKLFQPFERGDPSRSRETGGIGLGLTIARGIAGEHGGTLTLHNRSGGGIEAICRFPLR
ncbi:MAG TPA: ATP-binding protein [Sphingomonadaceae bacterium]|jgi:signal transduction histidine kinase|nr:ATP-binding protein [Sphingomonadaceae bacterium]